MTRGKLQNWTAKVLSELARGRICKMLRKINNAMWQTFGAKVVCQLAKHADVAESAKCFAKNHSVKLQDWSSQNAAQKITQVSYQGDWSSQMGVQTLEKSTALAAASFLSFPNFRFHSQLRVSFSSRPQSSAAAIRRELRGMEVHRGRAARGRR